MFFFLLSAFGALLGKMIVILRQKCLRKELCWKLVDVEMIESLHVYWTINWTVKFSIHGNIGYGDSYLDFLSNHSKVFRKHATLDDGDVGVRSLLREGVEYSLTERGTNSGLLNYIAGLLICFHEKLFLPSILNSVNFWRSIACIVLDISLAI